MQRTAVWCVLATLYLGNSELRWGQNCWPDKTHCSRNNVSKGWEAFFREGRGFVPTEALSAQRLLGEEGKKREEEREEEEREGGLLFQSRHPLRVKNQV